MDLVLVLDQLYTLLFYPDYISTDNKMSKFIGVGEYPSSQTGDQ